MTQTSPAARGHNPAATDLYANCIYRAAAELGLRIPEDVSVVGFSDDGFAQEMSPPLTTVRQPAYEIGRRWAMTDADPFSASAAFSPSSAATSCACAVRAACSR